MVLLTDVDINGVPLEITAETPSFWWIVELEKTYNTWSSVSAKGCTTTSSTRVSRKNSSIRKLPHIRRKLLSESATVCVVSETEQSTFTIVTNIIYIHKAITINGRPSQGQEEACKVKIISLGVINAYCYYLYHYRFHEGSGPSH